MENDGEREPFLEWVNFYLMKQIKLIARFACPSLTLRQARSSLASTAIAIELFCIKRKSRAVYKQLTGALSNFYHLYMEIVFSNLAL